MSGPPEPQGSIEVALAHAERLLARDPAMAAEQALEILKVAADHPRARLILGAAHRLAGQTQAALTVLEPLARAHPTSAPAQVELGLAWAQAGRNPEALAALERAVQLKPDWPDAWRQLADQHDAAGEPDRADTARAHYLRAATQDPPLREAAAALIDNDLPLAERQLRAHLQRHSTDVAALRMLAEVAARLRRYLDAQQLLERCLELAPSFEAARHNYAMVLNRQGKADAALAQV
ncbi:MAG: tetratricopeptide repeat protein, partial [Steroidobacteraceae bacterium]